MENYENLKMPWNIVISVVPRLKIVKHEKRIITFE